MKKLLFLVFIAGFVFSCKDNDKPSTPSTTVNLNFKATYDGEPFVVYQAYNYPDGQKIRFQNFDFFVSNITLLGEGTTADYVLSEVEFFDFEDNIDLAAAQKAQTVNFDKVPLGTYKGIQIDFGVPAGLNNSDAGKLPTDDPLRQHFSSHFWSDWGSFIFMKLEGIYDSTGDGVFNQSDIGFEHHPGTNDVLTSVTKLKSFTLEKDKPFELDLVADALKIYIHNGTALDLSDPANKDTQDFSKMPLAIELMSHWEAALSF